jgi:hypothetical protein
MSAGFVASYVRTKAEWTFGAVWNIAMEAFVVFCVDVLVEVRP